MQAENPEFVLFSFDLPQTFVKGMAFEELSEFGGQEIRKVELDVPKADLERIKQLFDFKDFDPSKERHSPC